MNITRFIIKSVDIKASKLKVFNFVSNPMNWPKWAVVNLQSVDYGSDGWFKMVTRRGAGDLKLHLDKDLSAGGKLEPIRRFGSKAAEHVVGLLFDGVIKNKHSSCILFNFPNFRFNVFPRLFRSKFLPFKNLVILS
jgi:hypothetical protein